jgi:GNAT superfamily N-acetyltransferase
MGSAPLSLPCRPVDADDDVTRAITVDRVASALTEPLRQRVLRAGQPPGSARFDVEDRPTTASFAARDPDGTVVGTAVVYPSACPWLPGRAAWRLRGMATDPPRQGQGIGGKVLAKALAFVVAEGGEVVWCNARTPAQRFYERAGFVTHGESWDDPAIGPHVAMWRDLRREGGGAPA